MTRLIQAGALLTLPPAHANPPSAGISFGKPDFLPHLGPRNVPALGPLSNPQPFHTLPIGEIVQLKIPAFQPNSAGVRWSLPGKGTAIYINGRRGCC